MTKENEREALGSQGNREHIDRGGAVHGRRTVEDRSFIGKGEKRETMGMR